MRQQPLENDLQKIKSYLLPSSSGDIKVETNVQGTGNISAFVDMNTNDIHIGLNRDWNPYNDSNLVKYSSKKGINDIVAETCTSLLYHEINHIRVCPITIPAHNEIRLAMADVLKAKGKVQCTDYVANAFEDIIVDVYSKRHHPPYDGCTVFFYDQGQTASKPKGMSSKRKYSPFYEAFVRINLELFGKNLIDEKLLKRFYTNKAKIKKAIRKTISGMNCNNKSLDACVTTLSKQSWKELAREFADDMADLLEEQPPIECTGPVSPFPSIPLPEISGPAQAEEIPGEAMEERMEKVFVSIGEEPGECIEIELPSELMTTGNNTTVLDAIYKKVADKITVFQVDEEELTLDMPGYIDVFMLSKKVKEGAKRYPDICWVIDTSGSMIGEGSKKYMPWGDKSRYHYALLGIYGIINWFESKNLADKIEYNVIAFSSSTLSTGWKKYDELDDIKNRILNPEFGGTELNENELVQQLENKKLLLVIMLSDGEIYNWDDNLKTKFKEIIRKNQFVFLQIGKMTETGRDLKKFGAKVIQITNERDLREGMLESTKKSFDPYV